MAKDGLGSVIDRENAHRVQAAKFYAGVTPMMQEPRQQWRRRARKQLKANRIMPTEGVNRARVSLRVIEGALLKKGHRYGRVGGLVTPKYDGNKGRPINSVRNLQRRITSEALAK